MRCEGRRVQILLVGYVALSLAASGALVAQGLPRARPEDAGLSSTRLQQVILALGPYVRDQQIPGGLVAVARHGKLVYLDSVGMLDTERGLPMRPDAMFRIYSMTKPITTVALAQLVERGKLRFDDPVSRFIPSFGSVRVYAGGPSSQPVLVAPQRPMTIEDLLRHTSGLVYGIGLSPVDSIYRRAGLGSPLRDMAKVADSLARLPLLFSPGAAWNYSVSLDVLGRVVEVASGRRLDEYLEQEVLLPLGMRETRFHILPGTEQRVAVEYMKGPGGGLTPRLGRRVWADYDTSAVFFAGGAGLVSTVNDYLRFAQMLLNQGELDGHRVLRPETVALIMRNQLPLSVGLINAVFPAGFGQGYGGAVLVDSTAAHLPMSPGTYSWSGNAGTHFWVDPKQQLIGIVMFQVQNGYTSPLIPEVQKLVYAALQN